MPLIKLLEDPENDVLPPPPPILKGADFPVDDLLLELRMQRQRAKRREAAFLSVIAHLALIVFLLLMPKMFGAVVLPVVPANEQQNPPQMTFLEMPKDLVTPKKPTQPKALSDQDRHFDKQTPLQNSLSAPVTRPAPRPQPAAPPPGPVANNPPAPENPPAGAKAPTQPAPQPAPPKPADNGLKLEDVPKPVPNPKLNLSIGSDSLEHAIQQAARDRASQPPGEFQAAPLPPAGGGGGARGETGEGVQILTDTQGVDFSAYMQRIIEIVRRNWYAVMPETVNLGTKGRVVLVFNINQNGSVPGIHPVGLSGTASLDEAAIAAVSASNPFPPLPSQFHGPFITLQFSFFYNELPPNQ